MSTAPMETMTRTYKSTDAFRRDAEKLARQGWTVQNTTEHQPRTGCARGCLLGFFSLIWKPKPEIVAVYTRPRP